MKIAYLKERLRLNSQCDSTLRLSRLGIAPKAALALILASLVSVTGQADVSYEKSFRVQALGTSGVLVAEGVAGVSISGERLRSAHQASSISPAMEQISPSTGQSAIILLDEQKKLELVPARLEYSELSLEDWRASLDYGNQDAVDAEIAAGLVELPVNEEDCRWSLPVLSSTNTGRTQTITGLEASLHLVEVQQTCEVPATGQACSVAWKLEQWTTTDMPGQGEIEQFRFELAQALGGVDTLSVPTTSAGRLMAMFRRGWNQVLYEAQSLDGFPVKTYMSLEMGGERCSLTATASEIPEGSGDSDWGTVGEIAKTTGTNTAKSQVASTAAQTAAQAIGGGIGGMIARTVADSAARRGIDKVLEKEEDEESEEVTEPEFEDPGTSAIVLFTVSTELSSLSTDQLHPGLFEVSPVWNKSDP